ncbi:hypothetical protein EK904_011360 [Melospiza melodia maxima]|nr:hypothetical protein EK904_011360 [Melospiza melodia maxima]
MYKVTHRTQSSCAQQWFHALYCLGTCTQFYQRQTFNSPQTQQLANKNTTCNSSLIRTPGTSDFTERSQHSPPQEDWFTNYGAISKTLTRKQ